jgi:hypothetical protein
MDDLPIGTVFELGGIMCEVVECTNHNPCGDCAFQSEHYCLDFLCMDVSRKDGKTVYAKEIKANR